MNILADESVDLQIVDRLRQEGHTVQYVAEIKAGITDEGVLKLANQEEALLLTADKDFGEMIFRQHMPTQGIMLIRLAGLSADSKADLVASTIKQHQVELPHKFAVIAPGVFRIRKLI
ncbi:MAG: DUF5615 family PIN-like protein [Anaerolineales bacterium]